MIKVEVNTASNMKSPQEGARDAARHKAAIDALAVETHQPIERIQPQYEQVVQRLQQGATVYEFLSVCALRNVRQILRKSQR